MNGQIMAAEMGEQPAVLERLLGRLEVIAAEVGAILPPPLAGITLVARGSSDNAALWGRYIFEMTARRPAGLAAPSIHNLYRAAVDHTGYLAVGISQSGETPEIVSVLRRMREQGARTVALVNAGESALAGAAEVSVELHAGEELAVPATKTVTATLLGLALVATALGEVPWSEAELAAIPGHVADLLADAGSADEIAADIDGADRIVVTGRGLLLPAALETALKARETSGIFGEGISPADLRHGPIAAVGEGFPVLVFDSGAAGADDTVDLIRVLRAKGARVHAISPADDASCRLPEGVPEALLPLLAVVRGQQIAAAIARRRHLDPDAPAGLSKVTLTH
jgi:glutamine---fructose-6-phosphate transaminase (isomerizing)